MNFINKIFQNDYFDETIMDWRKMFDPVIYVYMYNQHSINRTFTEENGFYYYRMFHLPDPKFCEKRPKEPRQKF